MAELKVSFTLGERDLRHFRREMARAMGRADPSRTEEVTAAAVSLIERARLAKPPDYVCERFDRLEQIVQMSYDPEWGLPLPVRTRIFAALAYLTDPDDMIPDAVLGLGFLDDAIMIELVSQELRHELDGYLEFCDFRRNEERNVYHPQGRISRDERMVAKRKALRARIAAREKAPAAKSQGRFKLW
jgi:uncharacterized membrane protein YkvA (DUF1232 family)